MSQVVHIRTTVREDGTLVVDRLPFHAGQTVDVTVAEQEESAAATARYPMRGSVLRYENPFEPACPADDWEVLR